MRIFYVLLSVWNLLWAVSGSSVAEVFLSHNQNTDNEPQKGVNELLDRSAGVIVCMAAGCVLLIGGLYRCLRYVELPVSASEELRNFKRENTGLNYTDELYVEAESRFRGQDLSKDIEAFIRAHDLPAGNYTIAETDNPKSNSISKHHGTGLALCALGAAMICFGSTIM